MEELKTREEMSLILPLIASSNTAPGTMDFPKATGGS